MTQPNRDPLAEIDALRILVQERHNYQTDENRKISRRVDKLNEFVIAIEGRLSLVDKNCDDACAENAQNIKALQDKHSETAGHIMTLHSRIVKLEMKLLSE